MKNYYLFLVFLTISLPVMAQKNVLKGQVLMEGEPIENISIVNRNTKATVQTDAQGIFEISANVNDEIIFFQSDNLVEPRFILVKEYDLNNANGITIGMVERSNVLEELEIDKAVTTESLGLANIPYVSQNPTNMDLKAIFKSIVNLFAKKSSEPKEKPLDEEQKRDLLFFYFTESKIDEWIGDKEINREALIYFLLKDDAFIQVLQEGNKARMELEMMDKIYQFHSKNN